MIQEYLTTNVSMNYMTKKYHIGHTTIPKWMRTFGIPMPESAPEYARMARENLKSETNETVKLLEAQIKDLKAELDREKLKNLALSTMIEVAEEELHIDIRKKAGAKQ